MPIDNGYPEAWEVVEQEMAGHYARLAGEWHAKWPHACAHCKGWGLFYFTESHGFKHGPSEVLSDPCDALPPTTCHRCGAPDALGEDGEGPCKSCGWNYDDGQPEC